MEQIFSLLFNQDEVSWQGIIYDLVRTEQMDPWDINISLIANKFIKQVQKLKEMDLRLSGKIVLASAIFLKIKSNRLLEEDLNALDALIASADEMPEDEFYEELLAIDEHLPLTEKPKIYPRTPQPRKRKISVFDLVNALEKALEVQKRRKPKPIEAPEVNIPDKRRDITLVITDIHKKITHHYKQAKKSLKLTFSMLLPTESKEDKVYTFIPLLHLDTQRHVDLRQEEHFGEIEIKLLRHYEGLAE